MRTKNIWAIVISFLLFPQLLPAQQAAGWQSGIKSSKEMIDGMLSDPDTAIGVLLIFLTFMAIWGLFFGGIAGMIFNRRASAANALVKHRALPVSETPRVRIGRTPFSGAGLIPAGKPEDAPSSASEHQRDEKKGRGDHNRH